jgi:hypothetical protein
MRLDLPAVQRTSDEPILAFGEAKSFASKSFEQKDIQRMEKLAKVFPGSF